MAEIVYLTVENDCEGLRLDSFVSSNIDDISRSHAQKLIDEGGVLLNGNVFKAKKNVRAGDVVRVEIPDPVPIDVKPENIPLDVVYEDENLAVINKQQGLTVHPANGVYTGTLVNALLYRFKDLSGINGVIRPGIVHRLDKMTSGLMLVAKNDRAHNYLAEQIASKTCRRIYNALVEGVIKEDDGVIIQPVGRNPKDRKQMAVVEDGRYAETHYKVLTRYKNNTFCAFELKTGRTHQIRVHCKFIGHPVVGDEVYGYRNQRFALDGQLLHSKEITFFDLSGKMLHFECPLPDYFAKIIGILDKSEKNC